MSHRHALAALVLLTACASEEPAPPPAPPPAGPDAGYVGSADGPTQVTRPTRVPAGHMLVNVTKADLSSVVLPLFEQQVGITITWRGDPRLVTLRLSQTIPWSEALSLVCQFTKTHATRDYQGRLVLKDGWGGELGDGDIQALQAQGAASNVSSQGGQRGGGRGSGGGAGAANPAWSDGRAAPASGGGNGIPQPTGAYAGGDEAGRLLRGANTRTSNAGP